MTDRRDGADPTAGDLVVDGLTWRPHGRHRPTLREIDLVVRPGERVLLAGPSGAGKSTLLRALAGLLDESLGVLTGSVRLGAAPPSARPGAVGLLLQDPRHATVAEYVGRDVAFGPENRARPRAELLSATSAALDRVRFPYGADHRVAELSGGETQRLALAGALALDPSFLLLDEPAAMLDPSSAATVRRAVGRAAAETGVGLVVVDHRLDGWLELCDRLVIMDAGGRLAADGPAADVLRDRDAELLAAGVWVPGAPPPAVPTITVPTISLPTLTDGSRSADGPQSIVSRRAGDAPALTARGLGVRVPGRGADGGRVIVADLDLTLRPGSSTVVTGPSGAGKTTLLRTLAGLHPAASGHVEVERPLGWVPQHAAETITRRTVRQEVLATSEVVFADRPDELAVARRRAELIITGLGLERLAEANPHELSGGEQRRLALAAAVVHRPSVLMLDEPTVGQDRHTWAAVQSVIDQACADGSAVLISTHDPLLVARAGRELRVEPRADGDDGPAPDHRLLPVTEPGSPPLARGNPLAGIVAGLGAAVGSFFVDDWRVGLAVLSVVVLLAPLAVARPYRVGAPRAALRLVPVALAALSVAWSALLLSSFGPFAAPTFPLAAAEATRICCLVVPGALVLGCLRPSALGDALAQRLRLPHRVVLAMTSSLLRLDGLADDWRRLRDIRTVRGLAAGRSPLARVRQLASLTVALLVGMLRSAQQIALSMDARGFAAVHRRTFALPSVWRVRDWLCVAAGLLLLGLPILLSALVSGI